MNSYWVLSSSGYLLRYLQKIEASPPVFLFPAGITTCAKEWHHFSSVFFLDFDSSILNRCNIGKEFYLQINGINRKITIKRKTCPTNAHNYIFHRLRFIQHCNKGLIREIYVFHHAYIYIHPKFVVKEISRYSCSAICMSIKLRYDKSIGATVRFCRV